MDIAKFLETPGSAQIWIANSLSGAHEAFIRRFDFVLKLPAMPLDSRLALAHRLFGPGELAERLARSMKSPAELSAASSWCEAAGEASWAVVSRRVAGHQAALNAAKAKGDEATQEAFTVTPAGHGGMKLSDFAGNPRLSAEIERIAGFFSEPARFAKLGAKIPKGYLLSGPPGSGKTWFVRVLASVAGVPMVIANGAMLAKSPEKFAEMFAEARKRAPCLVFVDEFDVCAGHAKTAGGMDLERQKVLNRLLGELDGFDPLEGVLFLGATHNGSEIDPAVRRSGRMSGHLAFGHPDKGARAEVWRLCLAGVPCDELDFDKLAESTRGFSNAEIVEAANRAKLGAAMDGKDRIGMREILAAGDAVYWGDPGDPHASEEERWRTCVHESGHALVALRVGHIAERMTARPRDGYSGAAQIHRDEGLDSLDSVGAKHQISILLGGYAAEKGVFGRPANGASSDLSRARTLCAKSMLDWALDGAPKGYLEGMGGPVLSQSALSAFESSSTERLAECLGAAETILVDEKEALLRLSKMLMERKELTRDEILEAVGPHIAKPCA
jgi:cell division protease FtsH